jgi:hypothetical protein
MAARGTRGLALDDLHKDASPTVSLQSANGEVSSTQIGARHAVARERIRAPRSQNYGSTARPPRFVPRDSDPEVRAHFRFDRVVCSNLANNAAGETSFSWRGGHLVGAARDAAPRAQTTSAHGASGHFRDASLMALWRRYCDQRRRPHWRPNRAPRGASTGWTCETRGPRVVIAGAVGVDALRTMRQQAGRPRPCSVPPDLAGSKRHGGVAKLVGDRLRTFLSARVVRVTARASDVDVGHVDPSR